MDCCGCNLEEANYEIAGDFLSSLGWQAGKHLIAKPADKLQQLDKNKGGIYADTVMANLASAPHVPAVLLWDRKVTARVPSSYPAAGTWLLSRVGYHFPFLGKLRHGRTIKALCTVLRDNMDPRECNVAPCTKALMGIIFAVNANNTALAEDMKRCALHSGPHLLPRTCDLVAKFAASEIDFNAPSITLSATLLREAGADLTLADRRALLLAKAGSTSPSTIGPVVLGGMESLFSPAAMIEMLVWLGVCQMIHRFYTFYDLAPEGGISSAQSTANPTESSFYMDPSQRDVNVVVDEVRALSLLGEEEEGAASRRPVAITDKVSSRVTHDDHEKSSIVRKDSAGGRLVLQGAEPVYLDESFVDSTTLSDGAVASMAGAQERSREAARRLPARFREREYVEEDSLTRITPEVGIALPPRPPLLTRPRSTSRRSGDTSLASAAQASSQPSEYQPAPSFGRSLPPLHPNTRTASAGGHDEDDEGNTVNERLPSETHESPRFGDRQKSVSPRLGSAIGSPKYRSTVVDGGVVVPIERSPFS